LDYTNSNIYIACKFSGKTSRELINSSSAITADAVKALMDGRVDELNDTQFSELERVTGIEKEFFICKYHDDLNSSRIKLEKLESAIDLEAISSTIYVLSYYYNKMKRMMEDQDITSDSFNEVTLKILHKADSSHKHVSDKLKERSFLMIKFLDDLIEYSVNVRRLSKEFESRGLIDNKFVKFIERINFSKYERYFSNWQ